MATATKEMSRRQALRRGAAAGAVIWAVPVVASSTAHASGGSNGSKIEGRLSSVTCVWDRTYFQPNQGTPSQPKHDYSSDPLCEINVGNGWQTLGRGDQFTIPAGQVLQFRPWSRLLGVRSTADEPIDETTTTAVPVEEKAAIETDEVPTTTEASTEDATTTTQVAPTTTAPAAPLLPPSESSTAVDTIVIDMSGRTDINVGDVYGYFRVVDAEVA